MSSITATFVFSVGFALATLGLYLQAILFGQLMLAIEAHSNKLIDPRLAIVGLPFTIAGVLLIISVLLIKD